MLKQLWLITGGAGYIGAHIADTFLENNKEVVLHDSLSHGLESRVAYLRNKHRSNIPLIVGNVCDYDEFEKVVKKFKPVGIIHTAALKSVSDSMKKSNEYFNVNYMATKKILELSAKHGIHNFIFSSTAAVYGAPDHFEPIKEDDPKNPISPYGASKLKAEDEVGKFLDQLGNFGVSLRFFNVVGTGAPELLDNSAENLVPIVISKLKSSQHPTIYGTNYPTPDGTCIRDYIDVRDIAAAHLAISNFNGLLPKAMNIGTGKGASVKEVIDFVLEASGKIGTPFEDGGERQGDPVFLTADSSLIKATLNFTAKTSLEDSIKSLF